MQRFHRGFTPIPPAGAFGRLYDGERRQAAHLCEESGWLLATELLAAGVDFSFAPVLDLDYGLSKVIGDRAFHRRPDAVADLARRLMRGMREAGMSAVGKHFPGHGRVAADSHHETPVDERRYEDIQMRDLAPFERLIAAGLAAIMPAHVIYPRVDDKPAGFSAVWLRDVLRRRLGFGGAIFSDDISMAGAETAGDHPARAEAALAAGCDMVLVCNDQAAAATVLERLRYEPDPVTQARLIRLHGRPRGKTAEMEARRRDIAGRLARLESEPELALGDDQIAT